MLDGGVYVGGVSGGHGLTDDGVVGAEFDGSTSHCARLSAGDLVEVCAVIGHGTEELISFPGFDRRRPEDVVGRAGVGGHLAHCGCALGEGAVAGEGVYISGYGESRCKGEGGDVHHGCCTD